MKIVRLRFCVVFGFTLFAFQGLFGQKIEPKHAVSSVISEYNESNVVLSPDGSTLYFTLSHHILNRGGELDEGDIWYAKRDHTNTWSEPQRLAGPVNNHLNNRVLGFSNDGKEMYLHGQYGKGKTSSVAKGISVSKWNGRIWTQPEDIRINHFKNDSDQQSGFLSQDGRVLLLSIDSYNSVGNEDIYVSFKEGDKSWSEPINLGRTINTKYQEFTPYLTNDNKTLFFATNGRGGEGSSDIYFSKRLDDSWKNWTPPQNLGKWVNGKGRDLNFFLSDHMRKVVWVTLRNSDEYGEINIREPSPTLDSLFSEPREEELVAEEIVAAPLFGRVTDQAGQVLNEARVELRTDEGVFQVLTDENGYYSFDQEIEGNVKVQVSLVTYIPQTIQVELVSGDQQEVNVQLIPAEVGVTVNLDNVLFKRGTWDFLPGSTEALNDVVQLMKENPGIEIELGGHTDNTGIAWKNKRLSKSRVRTVKKYLVKQGIKRSRISGEGYGGSKPIASNKTEKTRRLNRRVEFTILSNN